MACPQELGNHDEGMIYEHLEFIHSDVNITWCITGIYTRNTTIINLYK